MGVYLKRDDDKMRTATVVFDLMDVIVNNKDRTEVISIMKSVDLNVFRIGRVNKWKALYNWFFGATEEGFKILYPDADFNAVDSEIRKICKGIAKNEI